MKMDPRRERILKLQQKKQENITKKPEDSRWVGMWERKKAAGSLKRTPMFSIRADLHTSKKRKETEGKGKEKEEIVIPLSAQPPLPTKMNAEPMLKRKRQEELSVLERFKLGIPTSSVVALPQEEWRRTKRRKFSKTELQQEKKQEESRGNTDQAKKRVQPIPTVEFKQIKPRTTAPVLSSEEAIKETINPTPKKKERKKRVKRTLNLPLPTDQPLDKGETLSGVKNAAPKEAEGISNKLSTMAVAKEIGEKNPIPTLKHAIKVGATPAESKIPIDLDAMVDVDASADQAGAAEISTEPIAADQDVQMGHVPEPAAPENMEEVATIDEDAPPEVEPEDTFMKQKPEELEEEKTLMEVQQEEAALFIDKWRAKIEDAVNNNKFQTTLLRLKELKASIIASKLHVIKPPASTSEVSQEAPITDETGKSLADYVTEQLNGNGGNVRNEAINLQRTIENAIEGIEQILQKQIPEIKRDIMTQVAPSATEVYRQAGGGKAEYQSTVKAHELKLNELLRSRIENTGIDLLMYTDRLDFLSSTVSNFNKDFVQLTSEFQNAPRLLREENARKLAADFERMLGAMNYANAMHLTAGASGTGDQDATRSRFEERDAIIKQMQHESPPTESDLGNLGSGRQPFPNGGYQGPYEYEDMNLVQTREILPYGTLEFWSANTKKNRASGKFVTMKKPQYLAKVPTGRMIPIPKKDLPGKKASKGGFIKNYVAMMEQHDLENQKIVKKREEALLSNFKADNLEAYQEAGVL